MKNALKNIAASILKARQRVRGPVSRPLFLLGHMRSGSTLLLHLLVDHPKISGYGERNQSYRSPSDVDRLRVDVYYWEGGWWNEPTYVADQINHNRLTPASDLIRESGAAVVVLVRRPGSAIGSMVEVLGRHYSDMTPARAIDLYRNRLTGLGELVTSLREGPVPFVLTYEDLLERTDASLSSLSGHLKLHQSIGKTYRVRPETGSRGDPSQTIRSGRIVRDKAIYEAGLEDEVSRELEAQFERTVEAMRRAGATPGSTPRPQSGTSREASRR